VEVAKKVVSVHSRLRRPRKGGKGRKVRSLGRGVFAGFHCTFWSSKARKGNG